MPSSPSTTSRRRPAFGGRVSSASAPAASKASPSPLTCGSQFAQRHSAALRGSTAIAISSSRGECSSAACATSQRAAPATARGGPTRPSAPSASGTTTGTFVSRAPGSSCAVASSRSDAAPPSARSGWAVAARSAVPRRSARKSSSGGRRSHSRGSSSSARARSAAGSGAAARRVFVSSRACGPQLGRPLLERATPGGQRLAVGAAAGGPALHVRVERHRGRQQAEHEAVGAARDGEHHAAEQQRDRRGAEREPRLRRLLRRRAEGDARRRRGPRHARGPVERDGSAARRVAARGGMRLEGEQRAAGFHRVADREIAWPVKRRAGEEAAVAGAGVTDRHACRSDLGDEVAARHRTVAQHEVGARAAPDHMAPGRERAARPGVGAAQHDQVEQGGGGVGLGRGIRPGVAEPEEIAVAQAGVPDRKLAADHAPGPVEPGGADVARRQLEVAPELLEHGGRARGGIHVDDDIAARARRCLDDQPELHDQRTR